MSAMIKIRSTKQIIYMIFQIQILSSLQCGSSIWGHRQFNCSQLWINGYMSELWDSKFAKYAVMKCDHQDLTRVA